MRKIVIRLEPKRPKPKRLLVRTIERSVALGLILLIPAAVLLTASAFIGEAVGVLLATIGGVFFTVAVLSCLYDPFLRDVLTQEIFAKLELKRSLAQAGLVDVLADRSPEVGTLWSEASTIVAAPSDPYNWSKAAYLEILRMASAKAVDLTVFIPGPDAPWPLALAGRLAVDADMVTVQLRALPDELAQAWDATVRHPKSKLTVYHYEGVAGVGLTFSDTTTLLEVGPVIKHPASDRSQRSFAFESRSDFAQWAAVQLAFQGSAEPPTAAAVRPLPLPPSPTKRTKKLEDGKPGERQPEEGSVDETKEVRDGGVK